MGHERRWLWGSPQYREARGGDKAARGEREGGREGMEMGDRARGGQRVRGNFNMLRPFRMGRGTLMELGRRHFIMAYNPLRWGGTFMESRRRNFIMGYDPLGWGRRGIHGIRKRNLLSWDTRGGGFGGPPKGGRGGSRGVRGGETEAAM